MENIIIELRERLRQKTTDQDRASKRKILRPASPAGLTADEKSLGFRLPPLLKRIYIEIGNGGFGPGYGLIGMSSGVPDSTGMTAPEIYRQLRLGNSHDPASSWPEALLPICECGCAICSCVWCNDVDFPIRIFDPNVHDDSVSWADSFFEEAASFDSWINAWADDRDLWEEMYGDEGHIARILAARRHGEGRTSFAGT